MALIGAPELVTRLNIATIAAPAAMGMALWKEANAIMAASMPLVPVDLGILRASHFVDSPQMDGDDMTIDFGYGGAASAYAWVQHEELSYQHSVGQAKYLEEPVLAAESGLAARLSATLAAVMRI